MLFHAKWFEEAHEGSWPQWLPQVLRHRNLPLNVLEIGCHEGASTVWLLQNVVSRMGLAGRFIPDGRMVCVDPWEGSDGQTAYDQWESNVLETGLRYLVTFHRAKSCDVLPTLDPIFDVIYIDGDHSEEAVAFDTEQALRLSQRDGIIIWDDYYYETPATPFVRRGVDGAMRRQGWAPEEAIVQIDRAAVLFR